MIWYEVIRKSDNRRISVGLGVPPADAYPSGLHDVYVVEGDNLPPFESPLYSGPALGVPTTNAKPLANYLTNRTRKNDFKTTNKGKKKSQINSAMRQDFIDILIMEQMDIGEDAK